jgi:hypothetical protein
MKEEEQQNKDVHIHVDSKGGGLAVTTNVSDPLRVALILLNVAVTTLNQIDKAAKQAVKERIIEAPPEAVIAAAKGRLGRVDG